MAIMREGADEPLELRDVIGRRLAALRSERGLKVSQLARAVGLSASAISQIERGQARPSVATLFALSRALDVPADAFFSPEDEPIDPVPDNPARRPIAADSRPPAAEPDPPPAGGRRPDLPPDGRHVLRHASRPILDCRGGVQWQRLTPRGLPGLELLELVYEPHARSDSELYSHPGFEFLVVTSGMLRISLAFEDHDLAVGDSIAFSSSTPHRYENPTDHESRAFTVLFLEPLAGTPGQQWASLASSFAGFD